MFKICVDNEHNVLVEDGSLSLGWVEISVDGLVIGLFRNKPCMIFLTLTTLVDGLITMEKKQDKIRWVGEDSGKVFFLKREKNKLVISDTQLILNIPFDEFRTAVWREVNHFLGLSKTLNPDLIHESAFIDLEQVMTTNSL